MERSKRSVFSRYALLIVCGVAFLAPFALRGARMSLQRMTNQVRDWLPADFVETTDVEWFGRHFLGDQFVVVTWPGCSEDDPRYQKLVARLARDVAPPEPDLPGSPAASDPAGKPFAALTAQELCELDARRAGELGDQLGLWASVERYENWGQRGERWLRGDGDQWYFITPEGDLYRWSGRATLLDWLRRGSTRWLLGQTRVDGQLVASFPSREAAGSRSEFHADPALLNARFFKSLTTGPDVLRQLSSRDGPLWPPGQDDSIAAEEARQLGLARLRGVLFGPDGRQTCLILTLSDAGKRDLRRVLGRPLLGRPMGHLLWLATSECQIAADDLKMGGPPVDNVAIDEEGQITLARLITLSAAVGILLALVLVRSLRLTVMLFLIGGLSALSSLALVWWTGGTVDAIMMSMPSLVYVLAMSGALHLINYYREVVAEEGPARAPGRMLRLGWKASLLCATTTSLGLVSLYTSSLVPIRNFGVYSALGVMSTLVLLFTFLPAALELWPPRQTPVVRGGRRGARQAFEQRLEGLFGRLGAFVVRHHASVTLACVVVIGICSLGLFRITTSVHLIKFFDHRAKIIQDYAWLETHLAKLVPMELVVRVRPERLRTGGAAEGTDVPRSAEADSNGLELGFLERMELAARVHHVVDEQFGQRGAGVVGSGMSAAVLAPPLPPPGRPTLRDPYRAVLNRKLEEHRGEYLASDYLRVDREGRHQGSELWRVSLRVEALRDIDYGRFVMELKQAVEPVLSAYRYRDEILTKLASRSGGRGAVKARVAFLGVADPAQRTGGAPAASAAAVAGSGGSAAGGVAQRLQHDYEQQAEIDQTAIFARTLRDLLTCAGAYARQGSWHDASRAAAPPGYYTSAAWGCTLATGFDCVVLVRDCPEYDLEFLKRNAACFIDARDHAYRPEEAAACTAVERGSPIHVVYTGVVPLVYKAQRSLLESLFESTFWSFVTITPLMMLLARSFGAGIVVMLPNVLPVVIVFGGMGWLGIDIDVGSMMTASIALGVAVDDTIHFLTWFRDDLDRLQDRKLALLAAYRRCALPTMQAAAISGIGLSVFAISTFTPTQRFGYLMLTILFAGLVAELVMLPALLAGPLGRFCVPRARRRGGAGPVPLPTESEPERNREPGLAGHCTAGMRN